MGGIIRVLVIIGILGLVSFSFGSGVRPELVQGDDWYKVVGDSLFRLQWEPEDKMEMEKWNVTRYWLYIGRVEWSDTTIMRLENIEGRYWFHMSRGRRLRNRDLGSRL